MRRAAIALLFLAACGREAPAPEPAGGFRDTGVPVASTTRGVPADLNGEWTVSAAYPGGPARGAQVGDRVRIEMAEGGRGRWRVTDPAGAWVEVPLVQTRPGRYETAAPRPEARLLFGTETPRVLVLWADDDFRTAVVGTPDGSFGWVMDRPGAASADRAAAAREVLDFNGYDAGRLSSAPPEPPVPLL